MTWVLVMSIFGHDRMPQASGCGHSGEVVTGVPPCERCSNANHEVRRGHSRDRGDGNRRPDQTTAAAKKTHRCRSEDHARPRRRRHRPRRPPATGRCPAKTRHDARQGQGRRRRARRGRRRGRRRRGRRRDAVRRRSEGRRRRRRGRRDQARRHGRAAPHRRTRASRSSTTRTTSPSTPRRSPAPPPTRSRTT